MKILALESATPWAGVAAVDDGIVRAEVVPEGDPRQSETLLPAVDAALRGADWSLDQVGGVAVGIGPGSFTGLRVGLATLKGLMFADDRPVAAVPTLAAVARLAGEPRKVQVAALLDARRGDVYAAAYPPGPGIEPEVDEGLYTVETLAPRLAADCQLVGDAAAAWLAPLQALRGAGVQRAAGGDGPCAGHVGILGERLLAAGQGRTAAELVPRYVRRAEAEVRRTGLPVEPGSVG